MRKRFGSYKVMMSALALVLGMSVSICGVSAEEAAGENEWTEGSDIEINMISYAGTSQEPHKFYVADVMESKYPGLKIRLVPSESQEIGRAHV